MDERGALEVGALVRAPEQPNWGLGQVQSIVGERITITFENAGKLVLVTGSTPLELVDLDTLGR